MRKTNSSEVIPVVGRIALSAIFLMSGVNKLRYPEQTKQYMTSKRLPLVRFLRPAAATIEIETALSMMSGIGKRLGASTAALFLTATTIVFHDFWRLEGEERELQMTNFLKNFAIIGGLLHVISSEGRQRERRGREEQRKAA